MASGGGGEGSVGEEEEVVATAEAEKDRRALLDKERVLDRRERDDRRCRIAISVNRTLLAEANPRRSRDQRLERKTMTIII